MNKGCKTATILAAAISLTFASHSEASWWKKHIKRPIEKHVVKPIEHVVKPVEHAVEHTVVKPIAHAVAEPVKQAVVHDIAAPVVHTVRNAPSLLDGLKTTYYATSKATHSVFGALRTADRFTLDPVKRAVTYRVVSPVWNGISTPVSWVGRHAVRLADRYAGMKGSLLPGGKYVDNGLGWIGEKIGVHEEVFKSIDLTRDIRRAGGQLASDGPVYFKTMMRGVGDFVSFDPTRADGAADDVAESSATMAGNASMSLIRPVIHAYAHGLMYQHPDEKVIRPDGVAHAGPHRPTVIFINGVKNDEPAAEAGAGALAKHLNLPVNLIWNEGSGSTARFWLSNIEGGYDRLSNTVAIGPLRALQGDSTTRRITGAIVEGARTNQDLVFVAHSQGCLEVAGALQAAGSLGLGDYIRQHMSVILTGTPLVSAEIQPKPKALHILHNAHDAVGDIIGGNITNPPVHGNGHSFSDDYVPAIDPNWLTDQK